jgi:hypothetical protein
MRREQVALVQVVRAFCRHRYDLLPALRASALMPANFSPGQPVLIPGTVRDVYPEGDRFLLVVELGRGDGRTVTVTVGERVPVEAGG